MGVEKLQGPEALNSLLMLEGDQGAKAYLWCFSTASFSRKPQIHCLGFFSFLLGFPVHLPSCKELCSLCLADLGAVWFHARGVMAVNLGLDKPGA